MVTEGVLCHSHEGQKMVWYSLKVLLQIVMVVEHCVDGHTMLTLLPLMCSDTAWSIPCCAAVSASISVGGPLSAVGAPLCELGDDGTEGGTE